MGAEITVIPRETTHEEEPVGSLEIRGRSLHGTTVGPSRLPAMIDDVRAKGEAAVDISFPEIEKFDHLPEPRKEGPTAFVSVMEGCSKIGRAHV